MDRDREEDGEPDREDPEATEDMSLFFGDGR